VKWAIGIDPGFGETGMVLRRHGDDAVVEYALLARGPGEHAFPRTVALVDQVGSQLEEWISAYHIRDLDVALETPIYNANPHSFELQWRLVHAIEEWLYFCVTGMVRALWLTEVSPTTSKKLGGGRGGASKPEIAARMPVLACPPAASDSLYTVADAWAHSLSAWRKDATHIDFTHLKIGGNDDTRETT